ncbi:MAG: hypothetical protein ACTSO9_20420, partial [Candidatus Helarchaeota archaeon]
SKITCESRQRTVGCCPRIIEVVVLGNTNLLPLGRSSSILKKTIGLRVTPQEEYVGLDITQHSEQI